MVWVDAMHHADVALMRSTPPMIYHIAIAYLTAQGGVQCLFERGVQAADGLCGAGVRI